MIKENTANDARTPNNSIPSSDNARYNPPNQTAARNMNMMSELLPETVTLDGSENLSITTGINVLNVTLVKDVDRRMYTAWKNGLTVSAKESPSPRTHVMVSCVPENNMKR